MYPDFATHQGYQVQATEQGDDILTETYKMITYIATFYSHYGAISFEETARQ